MQFIVLGSVKQSRTQKPYLGYIFWYIFWACSMLIPFLEISGCDQLFFSMTYFIK